MCSQVLTEKRKLGGPSQSDKKERVMKVKLIGAVAVFAAFAILALTVGIHAAPAGAKATATVAAALPAANASAPEKHPEIRDALNSLRHAQEHMENAAHDFGGHRGDAIRASDQAQSQLAIAEANKRQMSAPSDYSKITVPVNAVIMKRYTDKNSWSGF
jgi:hypothetical protein